MSHTVLRQFIIEVDRLVRRTHAKSMLDYGCGTADLCPYRKGNISQWGNVTVHLYDESVEEFNVLPDGTFDGVLCCDVLMDHDDPAKTIDWLFEHANKFVFITVHASKDRPSRWWVERVHEASRRHTGRLYDLRITHDRGEAMIGQVP